MDQILEELGYLEESMVESGVPEEYGSWLLTVRHIRAQVEALCT